MAIQQGSFASSALSGYEYDTNTNLLVLSFRKGGTYYYYNVPPPVFKGLLSAGSKGAYFNSVIRGVYE